jgi:ATP-binding cassette, subfamily B, bacterial HlyB/CyaB
LKPLKILIFDEAISNLDAETAKLFVHTINRLKGKTTMLFIAHMLPKALLVDEVVRFGGVESVNQGSDDAKDRGWVMQAPTQTDSRT